MRSDKLIQIKDVAAAFDRLVEKLCQLCPEWREELPFIFLSIDEVESLAGNGEAMGMDSEKSPLKMSGSVPCDFKE